MTSKHRETSFESFPQSAPEYTEEILWQRVLMVVFGGLAALAIIVWGALSFTGSDTNKFDPSQLPATAAIPQKTGTIERVNQSEELNQALASAIEDSLADETKASAARSSSEPETTADAKTPAPVTAESANPANTLAMANTQMTQEPAAIIQDDEPVMATSEPMEDPFTIAVKTFNKDVTQATLSDAMNGLEPAYELDTTAELTDDFIKLYFYTDIRDRAGDVITYFWQYDGKTVAKVRIPINTNRWRSHSSKNITKKMRGEWEVVVKDKSGAVLASSEFLVPNSKL